MNDLFRFLLLRPADLPKPDALRPLVATFFKGNDGAQLRRRQAADFVAKHAPEMRAETLKFGEVAQAVVAALAKGSVAAADLETVVKTATGDTTATITGKDDFTKEEQTLVNWLVALKLVSGSFGADAAGLARLAQGYDAIGQLAAGRNPVKLRPLFLPDAADKPAPAASAEPGQWSHVAAPPPAKAANPPADPAVAHFDKAIAALSNLSTASFHVAAPAVAQRAAAPAPVAASIPSAGRSWLLSQNAIRTLPAEAISAIRTVGLDPAVHALPDLLNALHAARTDALQTQALHELSHGVQAISQVGSSFFAWGSNDYVGQPAQSMPTGHGTIHPVGIGDLLTVREHVLRYEGGDLAHVENILKSETLSRDTRRLERTETTILQESETTKEETRDTQTTDRFSLKRETSDTIKSDSSFKAGVSVDAKYGPFVEVKANADFATSSSSESSSKQASEFSKDVVDRSISKVVERVLERRTTTTIEEFEEKYLHSFTNVGNEAKHISGMYQWIDKIMRAQVYNYGKRMLFDVTVPEPATEYIITQSGTSAAEQALVKPVPFTINALQISEGNYAAYAKLYDVTGLEAPPPPVKTISKGLDAAVAQDPHESTKSLELPIDDGYVAQYALLQTAWYGWDKRVFDLMIGSNWTNVLTSTTGYFDLSGEISSLPVAYIAYQIELIAATIEIFCARTPRAVQIWQLKMHAAITQGYQAKQQEYAQALAQAQAAAAVQISGRNPAFNQRLIANELRKQCLTLLTAQQFDAFGALELSSQGYAQPNLARTAVQMPYVRFFEQAFEWEHIVYFFYPYFWGWKNGWAKRMLLDDLDPDFADFLRAGAGRVVFPVRPGFEAAVIHYLDTGEIWNGGPPPNITSSLYVPIVTEIAEADQRPGDEVPVGDPWEVSLPTTLVRIRPNDDLPTWEQVAGEWQATN
jgi:hypothetical protein